MSAEIKVNLPLRNLENTGRLGSRSVRTRSRWSRRNNRCQLLLFSFGDLGRQGEVTQCWGSRRSQGHRDEKPHLSCSLLLLLSQTNQQDVLQWNRLCPTNRSRHFWATNSIFPAPFGLFSTLPKGNWPAIGGNTRQQPLWHCANIMYLISRFNVITKNPKMTCQSWG